MRKLLFTLVALVGFGFTSNAQNRAIQTFDGFTVYKNASSSASWQAWGVVTSHDNMFGLGLVKLKGVEEPVLYAVRTPFKDLSKDIYITLDRGNTFVKRNWKFRGGFYYISLLDLEGIEGSMDTSLEIWFAWDDKVSKFNLSGFNQTRQYLREFVYNPFGDKQVAKDMYIDEAFKSIFESFVKIGKLNGVNLDYIYKYKISIKFSDLNKDREGKSKLLGVAVGSKNDELVQILIDRTMWNKMSELQKAATLYHELSHDILSAAHRKDKLGHLMYPSNKFKTITELVDAVVEIFREKKLGTLKTF